MGADLEPPHIAVEDAVRRALTEDLTPIGDLTSLLLPDDLRASASFVARRPGVVAGSACLTETFRQVDPAVVITWLVRDGAPLEPGTTLATVEGRLQSVLTAERTALNLISRMSGVATHTRRWADALEGTKATVLDTRKTTPGLRALEKYAVRVGGGTNKRMGLYDVAMIKDNHKLAAGSITRAYELVRTKFPEVAVQVEVTTLAEAEEAVKAGAEFLLCDNMSPERLREVVAAVGDRAELEATGNLTLETVSAYAATGVDYLSVGGLTHSSPILDVAMDLHPR